MAGSMLVFGSDFPHRIAGFQFRRKRRKAIWPLQRGAGGEIFGNLQETRVPWGVLGRYDNVSKPDGPLSQDTHTSSGLSIYGLGDST